MYASRTALIAPHTGNVVDENGDVWHTAIIRAGDTGGLMHYLCGWANNFHPPAWAFRYSTGELISNSGPDDIIAICTFNPSAGIYEGVIATEDGEFQSDYRIKVNGTEMRAQEFYNYCRNHTGEVITIQYRFNRTTAVAE